MAPNWLDEIKFDGYRMHAWLDRGRVQISFSPETTQRQSIAAKYSTAVPPRCKEAFYPNECGLSRRAASFHILILVGRLPIIRALG